MRTPHLLASFALLLAVIPAHAAPTAPSAAGLLDTAGSRPAAAAPAPFSVFVDPATGYAFVKTPSGWRFRGQLSADHLDHLPPGTYTRLIAPVSVGTGS